jgi:hypothetical protein
MFLNSSLQESVFPEFVIILIILIYLCYPYPVAGISSLP